MVMFLDANGRMQGGSEKKAIIPSIFKIEKKETKLSNKGLI